MTCYLEEEVDINNRLDFDYNQLFEEIVNTVLDEKECPYEATVNLLLTDNEGIHQINKEQRDIDRPTDVLSFPMIDFDMPAQYDFLEDSYDYFDPESGELLLGDIVLSIDKIISQAEEYGHSPKREYSFLIVHSLLHLLGYDHIEEEDRVIMEAEQAHLMDVLKISR